MTKTFKDLLSSGSDKPKPLFERGFFDMIEEVNLPALPSAPPAILMVDSLVEDTTIPDQDASITTQQSLVNNNLEVEKEAAPSVVQGKLSKKSKAGTPGNTPQPGIPLLPAPTMSVGSCN
ncbi:MAG: hypothetical protein EOO60_05595, partial [Hymenobacter sp.]